jgi:hypothetical protein
MNDEKCRTCRMQGVDEKCLQYIGRKTANCNQIKTENVFLFVSLPLALLNLIRISKRHIVILKSIVENM